MASAWTNAGAPESSGDRPPGGDLTDAELLALLEELHRAMRRRHDEGGALLEGVHPRHRQSAANLVDYLTLRQYDLRAVQEALARRGLSSLGRAEEHVITTLERVIHALGRLSDRSDGHWTEAAVGFRAGRDLLVENAAALLGPRPAGRATRIMVTMPSEAATDPGLVGDLMAAGMDCARINGAHDDEPTWARMVEHIRTAAAERAVRCAVLVDLPGPKLRTGPVTPGPPVVRLSPRRDAFGRPIVVARAVLVPDDGGGADPGATVPLHGTEPAGPPAPHLPVPAEWLEGRRPGEVLRLRDTRQDRRVLRAAFWAPHGLVVDVPDTTYVENGTLVEAADGTIAPIGPLPRPEQAVLLRPGDVLTLSEDLSPAVPQETPARIGVTLPGVLGELEIGERVFFDDGRIGGTVVALRPGEADVAVTAASVRGSRLRAGKGINFPDSVVHLPSLTVEDEPTLRFAVDHADLVGLSFTQGPSDVERLQARLHALGGDHLGIVLKIETKSGFEALPDIVLAAMRAPRFGVMVARGDLAVECGYERLAEVQEEMLWLCDAAHVPVVWATEVLDQMARTGRPSRAEISDAGLAGRAECVMLNKGPYITRAVASLDDILSRMSSHQDKKTALLRVLRSWPGPAGDGAVSRSAGGTRSCPAGTPTG